MKKNLAAAAGLALATALAACGGGGGSGSSASTVPVAATPMAPLPAPAPVPAPATPVAESCAVNDRSWPVCGTDGGGWGFENGQYCIARSFCPANRSALPTMAARSTPVDAKADARTQAVYGYLRSVWGKNVIAGQSDLTWRDSIDMAERVHADTGKYPALMGYDFMNYGMTADWVEGVHQTEEAIAFAARGGLVEFSWHWRDPALLKTPQVNAANFYAREADATKNTDFTIPVAQGALDRNSPAYRQIDDGIDLVAAQLKRLSDAGVTVLWRPLHEGSGSNGNGWFWWGRTRTDGVPQAHAYVLLWRHMYERLVNVHGLHNLIWVWNGQDPAWYPGDDVVDVISQDIYDGSDNKTYGAQLPAYQLARKAGTAQKLVALSENSFIPDPDKIAADGAWWLWFMTWSDGDGPAGVAGPNNFWTGDYYNTAAHKQKVYNHPLVITLDKLPKF
jgi:mannan endo-1,4-beta-mannosidase